MQKKLLTKYVSSHLVAMVRTDFQKIITDDPRIKVSCPNRTWLSTKVTQYDKCSFTEAHEINSLLILLSYASVKMIDYLIITIKIRSVFSLINV